MKTLFLLSPNSCKKDKNAGKCLLDRNRKTRWIQVHKTMQEKCVNIGVCLSFRVEGG